MLLFKITLTIMFVTIIQYIGLCVIVNKTAFLDISTIYDNGASVSILNSAMVSVDSTNNEWDIYINSKVGWQMLVDLDNTWGFHPNKISMIQFQLDSNSATSSGDKDLIVSFSVGAAQFITTMIEIDNSKNNWICPGFDQSDPPITSLASGNVLNLVNTNNGKDRICNACSPLCTANSCCGGMPSMNQRPNNNQFPLIYKLINDPIDDIVYFEFTNPTWSNNIIQKCGFKGKFDTNKGLQIYIGGDDNGESYKIVSYNLTYIIYEPPTATPTTIPTNDPSNNPTLNPTLNPTVNPTLNPSIHPTTQNPSISTSVHPTTNIPSTNPTSNPSISTPITTTESQTTELKDGVVAETTKYPERTIGNSKEKDNISSDSNTSPLVFIWILLPIICICVVGCIVYLWFIRKKKIKEIRETFGVRNKTDDYDIRALRINSLSNTFQSKSNTSPPPPSPPPPQMTTNTNSNNENKGIEINQIACSVKEEQFGNNLTSLAGVNNLLMDDVVNEMNHGDITHGGYDAFVTNDQKVLGETYDDNIQTATKLPPPPQKKPSFEYQSDNSDNDILDHLDAITTPQGDN